MKTPMRKNKPLMNIMKNSLMDLPSPSKLSVWWKFGSLMGLCLIMQIMTGLLISMHYTADMNLAFSSMSHICRDVKYGWLLRKIHAKTASFFFMCLYCHIGRGMYYGSYSNKETWKMGVILFLITMMTAFVGYVLPWGQMSFWAATVITKLLSAVPYMGKTLVQWVWGGFSVDKATLTRFFSMHFLLPFLMAALSIMHLLFLHQTGSKNPMGMKSKMDKKPFHSYFSTKDLVGFMILIASMSLMSLLFPSILTDPEKYIPANPLVTPTHIQPEWYFLFAYAILRSMPKKLGGVMALMASVLMWFMIPMLHKSWKQASTFRPTTQLVFWSLMSTFFILTWMGSQPVEQPFILMGQMSSTLYFLFFIMMFPMTARLEKSISY